MTLIQNDREDLLKNIELLKLENAHLKSLLEQEKVKNKLSGAFSRNENEFLVELNRFSLELAHLPSDEIFPYIVKKIKKIFNVRAVLLNTYDDSSSEIIVEYTSLSEKDNQIVSDYLNTKLIGKRIKISKEFYERMTTRIFKRVNSIYELSNGEIPQVIGRPIELLFNIGWFAGIALVNKNKLVGTVVLIGNKNQEFIKKEIVMAVAGVAAIAIERKKAEESFRESEKRFRELSELLPQIVYEMDLNGILKFVNKNAFEHFGYTENDFKKGLKATDMLIPEDRERALLNIQNLLSEKPVGNNEYTALRKDNTKFPILIFSNIIKKNSLPVGIRGIIIDISDRKKLEEQLSSSLREKEILLKEVHHRVKNNFQTIISLLNLQSNLTDDPKIINTFIESSNRIKTMALIHELLYRESNFVSVDFKFYSNKLISYLKDSYSNSSMVEFMLDIDNIHLSIDKMISCGLILNELISNSFKHAFSDGRKGEISISFKSLKENIYCLAFSNNGLKLADGFWPENHNSLGMLLVKSLTKQIGGELYISSTEKLTEFMITFREQL
jgi:PAS domain S-box-containing protein